MTQRLKTVLNGNQELSLLLAKAHALTALQRHFISVAPPNLVQASQVQALSLRLGTLSIAVTNATVAAKLRQLAPELALKMQDRGCEVSGIHVKVQVSFDRLQPKASPHRLSRNAKCALKELSLSLNDSPLKLALEKFAKIES